MTQLCENCGRRFDGDLTDGVCPYCGQRCSRPVEDSTVRTPPHTAFEETAAASLLPEEKPRQSSPRWKLCGILAACFLLIVFVPIPLFRLAQSRHMDTGYLIEADLPRPLPGDSLEIGTHGRVLHLGKIRPLEDFEGVQKGCQAVGVFCRYDRLPSDNYDFNLSFEVFLECDGRFFAPIEDYDLDDVYPELKDGRLSVSDFLDTHLNEGWFYFLIPENAETANFWVQEQHLDEEYEVDRVAMHGVELAVEVSEK